MALISGDSGDRSRRTNGALAALLLVLCGQPDSTIAHAQSQAAEHVAVQAQALAWEPPDLQRDRSRVERMAEELTPWGQVDLSARLDPSLRIRDYSGDGQGPEHSGRLSLSAQLDFADRPSTIARARQTLERARNGLHVGKIRAVRDALLAHGYLLIAQERLHDADRELLEATHELAQYRRPDPFGGGRVEQHRRPHGNERSEPEPLETRLERQEAQLSLREARLVRREAIQDLDEARAEVDRYALPAAARYVSIRFELPDPGLLDHFDTHDYRLLRLELLEAQAELGETLGRPLDDLRLRGAYRARAGSIDLEGGLINGTPGLGLGVNTTGGPERWELELSAQFVLDDSAAELTSLEQEVAWARQELESYPRVFDHELEIALASVQLAEEALVLSEEDVRIHEQRLSLARSELPAGVTEERAFARIDEYPDLARAQDRLSAARLRMYRAWMGYVRDVASLLELVGGQWQTAAPSE